MGAKTGAESSGRTGIGRPGLTGPICCRPDGRYEHGLPVARITGTVVVSSSTCGGGNDRMGKWCCVVCRGIDFGFGQYRAELVDSYLRVKSGG